MQQIGAAGNNGANDINGPEGSAGTSYSRSSDYGRTVNALNNGYTMQQINAAAENGANDINGPEGHGGSTAGSGGQRSPTDDRAPVQTKAPTGGNGGNGGGRDGGASSPSGDGGAGVSKSTSPSGGSKPTSSGQVRSDAISGGVHHSGGTMTAPIILDLAGTGINITELSSSNKFIDSEGSGLLHRTAWAGVGSGVLFYDPDGIGAITQKSQYVFTEWDPTAKGDLEALRNVFDSNGDGVFNASDAKFALFKIEVTNADGSTSVMTLAQAGITSINLKADLTNVAYADGSAITGQTTFTRSDSTTGTVANTTLASDAAGYAVTTSVTTDGSGNRVVVNTAYAADGSIAQVIKTVTSPSGNDITTSFDYNGDGVVDQVQTIAITTNAGIKTEVLTNRNGGNVLLDAKTTITSADSKTITILRDATGGGYNSQSELRSTFADGHRTLVITDLNPDGSTIRSESTNLSIDGLTGTVSLDLDSNAVADRITTHTLVVNGDTSRTETSSDSAFNGTLLAKNTATTSANGKVQTSVIDLDGDTDTDRTDTSTITVNANGTTDSVTTVNNGDGSLRSRVTVAQSADSLSKTEMVDVNGDSVVDLTTTDVMVINGDTSRDNTVSFFNTDASLRSRITTHIGADRVSKTVLVDSDGNGTTDASQIVAVDGGGVRTATASNFNADGSLINRSIATTSANGLSTTTTFDRDGNAVTDMTTTDVTVFNGDGTATQTVSTLAGNGSMFNQSVTTTSANGLQVTSQVDIDGIGGFDFSQSSLKEVFGDLSTRVTETTLNGNGSLRSQAIMNASANRRDVSTTVDHNGDGFIDQTVTMVKAANGEVTDTVTNKNRDGSIVDQLQVVTSANGLSETTKLNRDGNGSFETVVTDVTQLTADGGSIEAVETRNFDTSLRGKLVVTTSGNGLSQTSQLDRNGDGTFDAITSNVMVLNNDGSQTTTIANKNSLNAVTSQSTIVVSDDQLSTTLNLDINGDLVTDFKNTNTTQLNADGSQTQTIELRNANNSLRTRDVTVTSDDGRSVTISRDINGDGINDQTATRILEADGDTVMTTSNLNADGSLQSKTETIISDDGLTVFSSSDYNGDLTFDDKVTSAAVLNADGSRTTTVSEQSVNGSLIERSVTTVNASGLSRTTTNDFNGDGANDLTSTLSKTLSSNGTWTEVASVNNSNGSLRNKSTTVTSADQNTVTTSVDIDGNTINDRVSTRTIASNGDEKTVNNFYSVAGTLVGSSQWVTGANGLRTTSNRDFDGDGRLERVSTDETVLNNDGSQTRSMIFLEGSNKLLGKETVIASDDGFTTLSDADTNGDGVLDYTTRDITTIAANGSITRAIETRDGSNVLLAKASSTTSANGLSSSSTADYNGDGGIDRTVVFAKQADSSSITTTSIYGTLNNLAEKSIYSVSADGRTETLQQDRNGDGFLDRYMTRQVDLSNNLKYTYWSARPDGSVQSRIVDDWSANGLTRNIAIDFNADNTTDLTRATVHSFDAAGNDIVVFTETYGAGTLGFKEVSTRAANGFLNVTQYDFNGDGTFDETRTDTLVLPTLGGASIHRLRSMPMAACVKKPFRQSAPMAALRPTPTTRTATVLLI